MQSTAHSEFPHPADLIYLNHAAVSPLPLRSAKTLEKFSQEYTTRGSQNYLAWLATEHLLREQLKTLLNAQSTDDIALVKNTSEALSIVAYGLPWKQGDNVVTTAEEFPSNRIVWQSLEKFGVELRQATISNSDSPEQAIINLIDRNTKLLTVSSVQFGNGLALNLQLLGEYCQQHDILFCIDAIQSLGATEFDAQRYQADFVMADGHKWMLGPEGLGVFYTTAAARNRLALTQYGWHMREDMGDYSNSAWEIANSARRFECGSNNMLGIQALSASLSLLLELGIKLVEQQIVECAYYLSEQIQSSSELELLTPIRSHSKSGIVVFKHLSRELEEYYQHLQKENVICAMRGGGIRFSPHFYHTQAQLDLALYVARSG